MGKKKKWKKKRYILNLESNITKRIVIYQMLKNVNKKSCDPNKRVV